MAVIVTLIIGFLVGAVARVFTPGRDPGSTILTLALGMSGALLFAVVGEMVGFFRLGQASALLAGVAGAMLTLLGFEIVRGPRAVRR